MASSRRTGAATRRARRTRTVAVARRNWDRARATTAHSTLRPLLWTAPQLGLFEEEPEGAVEGRRQGLGGRQDRW
jgi:hypothetical protein